MAANNTPPQNTAIAIPERFTDVSLFRITGTSPVALVLAKLDLLDLNALRDQYAKLTTAQEFKLYLTICAQRDLNPFANQIFCIVRGTGKNRKATIQVSIDGLRAIAAKGRYAGSDPPEFGPMKKVTETPDGKPVTNDVEHPEWCKITTYTLGPRGERFPHPAILYWDEFVPLQGDGYNETKREYSGHKIPDTWRRMKRHMLAKCTEAASIRKGNPECGGLYLHEEMEYLDAREASDVKNDARAAQTATVRQEPPVTTTNIVEGTGHTVDEDLPPPEDEADDSIPEREMTSDEDLLRQLVAPRGFESEDLTAYFANLAARKRPSTPREILGHLENSNATVWLGLYLSAFRRWYGKDVPEMALATLAQKHKVKPDDLAGQVTLFGVAADTMGIRFTELREICDKMREPEPVAQ